MKPLSPLNGEIHPPHLVDKVRLQLQRILDSQDFKATARQRDFLRFVVTETIEGRAVEVKGYTVAVRVFERNPDFDQTTDPIVSIEANNLRRSLERYYLTAGKRDPICIDIPKGTYVPTFVEQAEDKETLPTPKTEGISKSFRDSWPTLVVRPFRNLTGDSEFDYLSVGLTTELAVEIGRSQEIRVLMVVPDKNEMLTEDKAYDFAIEGTVRKDKNCLKVDAYLVDPRTRNYLWGDIHRSDPEAARLLGFQEEVARIVTAKISCESGIIPKALSIGSRKNPRHDLESYEAILLFYDFVSHFSYETFSRALDAFNTAIAKDPECALIWSMLGRLYSLNYSLELFYEDTPLQEALSFAEKGVELDPANQRIRLILASILQINNELKAGLIEVERAWALNPESLIFLDGIGYLMTLLGDWERGPALIRKAIELNPYHSFVAYHALWVDCIRRGAYEEAYLHTLNFRTPGLFWQPMMKAACLGLLERYEEGKTTVDRLLELKPDFQKRGLRLIRHYIKFQEIVERMADGFSKLGLTLESD